MDKSEYIRQIDKAQNLDEIERIYEKCAWDELTHSDVYDVYLYALSKVQEW